jgi:hypothetical protein
MTASELLKEYFMVLGGFALVTSGIMRVWGDLLLPSGDKPGGGVQYTPDELRMAIAAKVAAQRGKTADETARKLLFLGAVSTFPERVGKLARPGSAGGPQGAFGGFRRRSARAAE